MKNFSVKKEALIWVIIVLPFIYLMMVWKSMPAVVPTHFGIDGQPNDWSSKRTLLYMDIGMLLGIYALFLAIPYIDPKGKISAMGNKYFLLKLFMMLFMSVICFFTIQSAMTKTIGSGNSLFVLVGALFVFLGNYMQSVKPNYFIGIRTPWTLENETIWRKTHVLGGRIYFIAGLLVMILPFVLKEHFHTFFAPFIIGVSPIPVVYSFWLFRKGKSA